MPIPQAATETSFSEFLKATIAGGLLFLLPLVLVALLLGHAYFKKNEYSKALQYYEAVLANRPGSWEAGLIRQLLAGTAGEA